MKLMQLYHRLLKKHSYQGWWPVGGEYFPGDYSRPRNDSERFEICVGAILTQNTTWKNVEKVLKDLREKNLISARAILKIPQDELALCIRSSGYHNQKARKLKEFAEFYIKSRDDEITREKLLSVWGIGKETADSILLYAYKKPYFVVDAYTRRLFEKLFGLNFKEYDLWQEFFHDNLSRNWELFNEFHALIVAEGKTERKV